MRRLVVMVIILAMAMLACTRSASKLSPTATPETAMSTTTGTAARTAEATPEMTMTPAGWCQVTGSLNVRVSPGADAPVIGWLRSGDQVAAGIAEYGEWRAVVTRSGLRGYAHGKWIECGGE